MFDIGFAELLLLAVVGLLVLGPERLPEAARTLGVMLGKARRSFNSLRSEIQRELRADELRAQLEEERRKSGIVELGQSIERSMREAGQPVQKLTDKPQPDSADPSRQSGG